MPLTAYMRLELTLRLRSGRPRKLQPSGAALLEEEAAPSALLSNSRLACMKAY